MAGGIGSVEIQWLTRKIGAWAGPRFGRQLVASLERSVSWSTFGKV
jgi:hypothetical protein